MLEKEKAPGLIFGDTQWGNPLTSFSGLRQRTPPRFCESSLCRGSFSMPKRPKH